jgi:hypothetical protein
MVSGKVLATLPAAGLRGPMSAAAPNANLLEEAPAIADRGRLLSGASQACLGFGWLDSSSARREPCPRESTQRASRSSRE